MHKDTKYSRLDISLKFIRYWWMAGNAHSLHSPFLYHLYTRVIRSRRKGAERAISRLKIERQYRDEVISHRQGRLLSRLVAHFKYENILELGTCVGVGTAYLAVRNPQAQVISIDKDEVKLESARRLLDSLGIKNCKLVHQPFADGLLPALEELQKVDLVFMDGDHYEAATIAYFEQILPYVHKDSLIIIHDIHYSPGMEKAWERITKNPHIRVSIDLFSMGLIFFREGLSRQDYILRF